LAGIEHRPFSPPAIKLNCGNGFQVQSPADFVVGKVTDTWVAGRDKCLSKFTRQKEGQDMAETDNFPLSPKPARA
jgi:hypothetical protein